MAEEKELFHRQKAGWGHSGVGDGKDHKVLLHFSFTLQPTLGTAKGYYLEVITGSSSSQTWILYYWASVHLADLIIFPLFSPPHPALALWFSDIKPLLIPINTTHNSVYCICHFFLKHPLPTSEWIPLFLRNKHYPEFSISYSHAQKSIKRPGCWKGKFSFFWMPARGEVAWFFIFLLHRYVSLSNMTYYFA